ncbi:DUF4239 domain-containing protein [Paraburkholderia edwinii]|uniref:DUF4239 domain-containing protein n=1 Tax=Paraburkholderia edwinii TaxID=2861782 RepID=A0ABX8V1G7_9BURK|nr:DUF4239 domain-containing protein [Paraburkholderia edwinii]QYD73310.1 DUF4239 domain-containing protein [Paraburkholderia edwinii]
MIDSWLHNLPIWEMAIVCFAASFLVGWAIHVVTGRLAAGPHGRSWMTVSPGLLSPIGVIFGLLVAFTAAQVWTDTERASAAVAAEASALRSVVIVSAVLPEGPRGQIRELVKEHIEHVVDEEWPMMARGDVTLKISPPELNKALQLTLSLTLETPGQQTAQREVATYLEQALEARRQRILVSRSEVNPVKWLSLIFLGGCLQVTVALVHCHNRLGSAVSIGLFSAGFAAAMLLILAHDRPFTGQVAVRPASLLQVMPDS